MRKTKIRTLEFRDERLNFNNVLKIWREDPKTKELFDNNELSPTNNNGLYDLIKEQMESGNKELIRNVIIQLGSGTAKRYFDENHISKQKYIYKIEKAADFLSKMGFKGAIDDFNKIKDRNPTLININKWFNDKQNIEFINIIKNNNELVYYPSEAIKIIKDIYNIINFGTNENKLELNNIVLKNFNLSIDEIKELNLYEKYNFNTKIKENIDKIKKQNTLEYYSKEDLIKELTKNNDILKNDELFDLFVSKVLNMEFAEIKGWLITAIKSDFEDIKKIIMNENDSNKIKENIFDFINSRSITFHKNKIDNPFKKNEENGLLEFSISKSGMPDVLYFPKNKNEKPISAMNVTTDPKKSNTILLHSIKSSIIGNKIINNNLEEDMAITLEKYKNENSNELLSFLTTQNNVNIIDLLLKNQKTLSIDNIFNQFNFSVMLNSSSLSVFNIAKSNKKQRTVVGFENLIEIEKQNVLMYSFFQTSLEDKKINNYNISNENKLYLKNFLNDLICNIDISILSNEGHLTTLTKRSINEYGKDLVDLFSNKIKLKNFIEANKIIDTNDLGDEFKFLITNTFYHLISDKNSRNHLIKNIANGSTIDLKSFIKLDQIDNLSLLKEEIQKVVLNNINNKDIEIKYKIDNLNNFIESLNEFKDSIIDRNEIEVLVL